MEKLKLFISNLPTPWKYVAAAVVSILIGIALAVGSASCSMVRTSLDGSGRLSTSVNQSVADSVNVSVNIYPRN